MKLLLKTLGALILFIAVFTVVLAFSILEWPRIVVNRHVIAWGAAHSERFTGVHLDWREIQAETGSESFFHKRVKVRFHGLCAQSGDVMKGCFRSVDLALGYRFDHLLPRLSEIGPTSLLGGDVNIHLPQARKTAQGEAAPAKRKLSLKLPEWLAQAKIEPYQLGISRLHAISGKTDVRGTLQASGDVHSFTISLAAEQVDPAGHPLLQASARSSGSNSSGALLGPWKVLGSMNADLRKNGKVQITFGIAPERTDFYRYRLSANYDGSPATVSANARGTFQNGRIQGELWQRAKLKPASPERGRGAQTAEIRDCRYDYERTNEARDQGKLVFSCPVRIGIPAFRDAKFRSLAQALQLEREAIVDMRGDFNLPYPPDLQSPVRGRIHLRPGPLLSAVAATSGGVDVTLSAVPSELPKFDQLVAQVAMRSTVPEFGKVVHRLSGTRFAVPAPIQSLRGPITLAINGPLGAHGGKLDLRFDSNLKSPNQTQRFGATGGGQLALTAGSRRPEVNADFSFDLSDVAFALPKLDMSTPPQMLPDPRLVPEAISRALKRMASARAIRLEYAIRVRTPPSHPIELSSGFTPRPIKINMNLAARSPGDLTGAIQIHRFNVNLAGGRKGVGEADISIDTHERGGVQTGDVRLITPETGDVTVVPPPQAARQAAGEAAPSRVGPKFNVPLMRIVSSMLLGTPLNEVAIEPGFSPRTPEFQEHENSQFLEIRKRS